MRSEGKPAFGHDRFVPSAFAGSAQPPPAAPIPAQGAYAQSPAPPAYASPAPVRLVDVRSMPGTQPRTAPPPSLPSVPAPLAALPAANQAQLPVPQPYAVASAAFARYFQDVRARIGLPLEEIARRLSADPRVVHALESGAVAALPAWPEVERIVTLYMRALSLDPAPPLRAIAAAIEQQAIAARARLAPQGAAPLALPSPAAAASAVPEPADVIEPSAQEDETPEQDEAATGGAKARLAGLVQLPRLPLRRLARTGAVLAAMAAVAGGAVLLVQSSLMKSGRLPAPAAEFMRSASDSVALFFAPKRDGLRWIEVADPRTRRGDKLQTARR
jgi:hypothetical protein